MLRTASPSLRQVVLDAAVRSHQQHRAQVAEDVMFARLLHEPDVQASLRSHGLLQAHVASQLAGAPSTSGMSLQFAPALARAMKRAGERAARLGPPTASEPLDLFIALLKEPGAKLDEKAARARLTSDTLDRSALAELLEEHDTRR